MANINISDLSPAGADLFLDSESYLNDLREGEMTNTLGGDFSFRNCWRENGKKRQIGSVSTKSQYRFRTVSTILSYLFDSLFAVTN